MKKCPLVLILLCAPWGGSAAWAQNVQPHTVRATGEATVKAKPDQVLISIGVRVRAATADDAIRQSAAKTETLMTALKSLAASRDDLRTSSYSVEPQYQYAPGQAPAISGYEATHVVELRLNDVNLAGQAIDTASKSGANMVNGIDFTMKDDTAIRQEAIAKATLQARGNAESIAKALNVTVTGVYAAETVEAGFARPVSTPMVMKAMTGGAPTQIQSGDVEVRASVTVYLEVR